MVGEYWDTLALSIITIQINTTTLKTTQTEQPRNAGRRTETSKNGKNLLTQLHKATEKRREREGASGLDS